MKDQDAHFDSLLPPLRLDRRGFLATTAAAGFSLAAGPVAAQTAIATDAKGLVAGKVEIPTSDGKIPAYRAAPEGKKNLPTILVVQEIFGVHEYIQDVCRRLAHLGYLAIAPELYVRQGDPSKYTEIPKLQAEVVSKVPDKQVTADLDATAAWAAAHGGNPDRLGIVGFCWGGRQVWLYAAHNAKLKAGAAWYGQLAGDPSELKPKSALAIVNDLKAPVLGAYGGKDAGISQTDVDRMRVELAKGSAAAKASRIDIYPEAGHAFHADYRPSYRKAEAEQAWTRMLDWFKQNGL
ncbi:MAG: carboxymethylenebutenolidase [Achromobacter mucicolens]|jgi:carboxymethylenebutenolidase|uniref:dienelactone hydrolase family protein n=1 Tax=Achromobacter TaxID=222 RepID=UPI0006FDDD78|nr:MULTISPECIES: dienelactone hydrolase family protein [Achromobacter]KRB09686.1 carboxymethylenebutenolidase [Achromobacter sp. Root170]MDF2864221.1 carboxymethylenebutenolidase [Achromobacter mucicolens]TQJ96794.1 carboxymethylenebutenolidase [Achromobacter sp. SLBN-14]